MTVFLIRVNCFVDRLSKSTPQSRPLASRTQWLRNRSVRRLTRSNRSRSNRSSPRPPSLRSGATTSRRSGRCPDTRRTLVRITRPLTRHPRSTGSAIPATKLSVSNRSRRRRLNRRSAVSSLERHRKSSTKTCQDSPISSCRANTSRNTNSARTTGPSSHRPSCPPNITSSSPSLRTRYSANRPCRTYRNSDCPNIPGSVGSPLHNRSGSPQCPPSHSKYVPPKLISTAGRVRFKTIPCTQKAFPVFSVHSFLLR